MDFDIIHAMSTFKKICVLMGGTSNEREVSLVSGKNVTEALASLGKYEVIPVVLNENSLASLPECDACFLALHGGWGENGGIQSMLDAKKIPYTGPGAKSSRIAIDKIRSKMVLEMNGLPTAKWTLASPDTPESPLPLPVVVKPPSDGSSVGISKVSKPEDWPTALKAALDAQPGRDEVMVEDFIDGREMTVGVLDGAPFPVVEICAKGGWYGYAEKYESDETQYPFPADSFLAQVQQIAVDSYRALDCRGIVRIDFRIDKKNNPFVLELNTLPGMTEHSLVPKAAAKMGISFPELCDKILSSAKFDVMK
jgi:D-alanine-D-alanine ligase